MENWKRYLKTGTRVVLILILATLVWGVLIEPRLILDRRSYEVSMPGLSPGWDGWKVGLIADFQIGMWLDNPQMGRKSVQDLISVDPDLVLLGGDFVYHPTNNLARNLETIDDIVKPLHQAGIPAYAVLGNHDYGMTDKQDRKRADIADQVRRSLESAGLRVLHNEAVNLEEELDRVGASGEDLYLVGIGPHIPGEDRVEVAFSQVEDGAPRLVMMHNPDTYGGLKPYAAPLAVAGHTHGGQIRAPFSPQWSYLSLVQEGEVHVDGWIEDYGREGNRLYVNRGIGFSLLPMRLNCPPEVTVFTLRSGS